MSKVHIWTAVAVAVMFSAPLFGQEEKIYSTVPAIGADWVNPKTGQIEAWADKGEVTRVGDIVKGNPDWPANKKFYVPSWWEVELYCTRASTDWDTVRWRDEDDKLQYAPDEDRRHAQWPRWHCNFGEFLPPNSWKGTEVVWQAPEITDNDGVRITLFENDDPKPINPPDTGNRDDGGPGGTGSYNNQDMIWFVAQPMEVTLTVRSGGETTSTNPGPDSRNKLGLWWTNDLNRVEGKEAWSLATTEGPPDGGIVNGTSVFLVDEVDPQKSHPLATGSVLKTEIYATIHMMLLLPDRIYAQARKDENWAICQRRRHGLYFGEHEPYAQSTDPDEYTDEWVWDKEGIFDISTSVFNADVSTMANKGWLYFGDAPGLREHTDAPDPGEEIQHCLPDLKTWVAFYYLGRWCDVLLEEDAEEWGVELHMSYDAAEQKWRIDSPAVPRPVEE